MTNFAQKDANGVRLSLHVQPGAAKNGFCGIHGEALKVRVAARAVDGAANKELCEFLAESFGVAKTSVSILQGQSSRKKMVFVQGDADKILLILADLQ